MLENASYYGWILLLFRILGVNSVTLWTPRYRPQAVLFAVASLTFLITTLGIGLTDARMTNEVGATADGFMLVIGSKLALTLFGIVSIEQVARNTRPDYQWNLKFVTLGLAIVFGYGFVVYADALLFRTLSSALTIPQGVIYALATPFLAVASMRNPHNKLNMNVSREFVFRTGALALAGAYLLIMSAAGYYVRIFGGEWGDVLLTILAVCGAVGFAILALSTQLRRSLRVLVQKHLFEYKYDYRAEWLRLNRELTAQSEDDPLATRAIRALANLVGAPSGAYWEVSEGNILIPKARYRSGWSTAFSPAATAALVHFFAERRWVIDLDEYQGRPASYRGLTLGSEMTELREARFIVPLCVNERLLGIVVLGRPAEAAPLIWEDYDILKMVAQQAAGFLALERAQETLSDSKQFHMMQQLSAYVVHDLKTISSQMRLLLNNAPKHKHNPAFIDDLLATVENATAKMDRLLQQLREPDASHDRKLLNLTDVVSASVEARRADNVRFVAESDRLEICADRHQLESALAHIIQNAIEATTEAGDICVTVKASGQWALVEVTDSGVGMTPEFIERELFVPFVTTKGVAGIGVGAYQSRDYVRSLGGDVEVESEPGKGSRFLLRFPAVQPSDRSNAPSGDARSLSA